MRRLLIAALLFAACLTAALSQSMERTPEKLTLTVPYIADSEKADGREFVFVLNGVVAYRTLDGLKRHIKNVPKGSTLTWAPACRSGDVPTLSSKEALDDFKAYCQSCGVTFVLVPSG